jgi:hypothetical protein
MLPTESSDPEARDTLCMWMDSSPTNDHVAKLITSKERMKKHYKEMLNQKNGELT